jgi:protein-disulfide isomerase
VYKRRTASTGLIECSDMKNPWVLVGLLAVVLIGGAVWYSSQAGAVYNEGVTVQTYIKGNPDATVKLVEYSDFQCPACAAFQPVIADIIAEYGGRIAFEYRHFPLTQIHRLAEPAARAAEAAGQQGKFYEYHDLLFINQSAWSNSTNPAQFFIQYATELGLDIEQFTRQQRSSILRDHVRDQFNEARALGFTGTPSFVLNGEVMQFQTYDEFRQQIIAAVDPAAASSDVVLPTTITPAASGTEVITEPVAVPAGEPEVRFGI